MRKNIKANNFVKELVNSIPSNVFLAKVLSTTAGAISKIRQKYNLSIAGRYRDSDVNIKKFMSEYVAICIKYKKNAEEPIKGKSLEGKERILPAILEVFNELPPKAIFNNNNKNKIPLIMRKRTPSIKVDAFVKELVTAIPSNIFLSKVLNISPCSVSRIRKKYKLGAAGKYSNSDTNLKKFMPEYVELCIKHNKKADGLSTKAPVSKPEINVVKGQVSYPVSQIPFSEVANIVNINGRDIEVKNGDKLEIKEGKVLLIREL